jgi:hypothetical protein
MENDKMLLLTRRQAIAYVQEQMSVYRTGREDRSLSDELIEERRREAQDE